MNLKTFSSLALGSLLLIAGAASAANFELASNHRFPASAGLELDLENLVGAAVIEGTTGKELLVEAKIMAGADSDAEARRLAGLIKIVPRRSGDRVVMHIEYPLDDYRDYKYDLDGSRGWGWNTNTEYQGKRVHISHRGVDLHVDLKVSVPKGVAVRLKNVAGTVDASGVDGDLDLDTSSGPITARDTRGKLRADTGSGRVSVTGHVGSVDADTGSGGVTVVRLEGDLNADTGSGGVRVRDSKGKSWSLDTGSGRVEVEDSTIEELEADTGSGGIQVRNAKGLRILKADAGSGSVRLDGDFSTLRDVDVDTGSGGVTLTTTAPLNLRIDAGAGSGGIDIDLDNLTSVRTSRGDFTGTAGKGEGTARFSTGSGGIRLKQN